MPRWAKIVLIVFGVFVVIGLLVPYFVDVDRYRPRIIAEMESRTGRKIEIGHIRAFLHFNDGVVAPLWHAVVAVVFTVGDGEPGV